MKVASINITEQWKQAREGYHILDIISKHRSFAMGMAMISIVLFHIQFNVSWMWPFNLLGYLGVDVFQFVSGLGCTFALKKYNSVNGFYHRRLLRVVPTCLFVGVVVYLIDLVIGWEFIRYASVMERICSLNRWYIPLILLSYALCPLFYKLIAKYRYRELIVLLLLVGCAAVGCFVPKMGIWKWPWFLFRIPPFIVGMYVGMSNFKLRIWHIIGAIAAFFCAVSYLLVFWWAYFREWPTELFALPYSLSLPALVAGVCVLGKMLKNSAVYKLVELLGLYSLEIYLIHEVVLSGLRMTFDSQLLQAALLCPIVVIGVVITKYGVNGTMAQISRLYGYLSARLSMRFN